MENTDELLSLLKYGLETVSLERSQAELGDRSTYLGMSDLSLGMSCPRAVVAGKLCQGRNELSLQKLLTLERGHWLEHGIEDALSSIGQRFISQLEIKIDYGGTPIKAHLDLVLLDSETSSITVLELKSMGKCKDVVMDSHEAQLKGQIGLLSKFWNEPVFTVNGMNNQLSFPNLINRLMGIDFASRPVDITGYILTISPTDCRAFGPYRHDANFLKDLLENGSMLWNMISDVRKGSIAITDIPVRTSFSPLCDYCVFNKDCPKFKGIEDLGLEGDLSALIALKAGKNALEDEIHDRESQLKAKASLSGRMSTWIDLGGYRFKVSLQKGRLTVDQALLKHNLTELCHLDEAALKNIFTASMKEGTPFERLYISPVN
jgi:hypothetical protein